MYRGLLFLILKHILLPFPFVYKCKSNFGTTDIINIGHDFLYKHFL